MNNVLNTNPNTLYGMVNESILTKAKKIKLLVCDVDGVFSDGRIYLGNDGEELKALIFLSSIICNACAANILRCATVGDLVITEEIMS